MGIKNLNHIKLINKNKNAKLSITDFIEEIFPETQKEKVYKLIGVPFDYNKLENLEDIIGKSRFDNVFERTLKTKRWDLVFALGESIDNMFDRNINKCVFIERTNSFNRKYQEYSYYFKDGYQLTFQRTKDTFHNKIEISLKEIDTEEEIKSRFKKYSKNGKMAQSRYFKTLYNISINLNEKNKKGSELEDFIFNSHKIKKGEDIMMRLLNQILKKSGKINL